MRKYIYALHKILTQTNTLKINGTISHFKPTKGGKSHFSEKTLKIAQKQFSAQLYISAKSASEFLRRTKSERNKIIWRIYFLAQTNFSAQQILFKNSRCCIRS